MTSTADLQGPAGNTYDKYGTRNPLARYLVRRFLAEFDAAVGELAPKTLLDVGCGEGVVTERIARALPDTKVVGVDVADAGLLAEWGRRAAPNLTFAPASAYALPYADRSFDVVCGLELLEHLEKPGDGLSELARVAVQALVLSVPREPLWRVLNLLSGRYLRALGNTPGHVNHWSAAAFRGFVAPAGAIRQMRTPLPWTLITVAVER